MTEQVCIVCGASFVGVNSNQLICSDACRRKRHAKRMVAYRANGPACATADELLRYYRRATWGLDYDPYATGALCADAMHCPVM